MENYKIIDYKGIKLMDEINTRPHANLPIQEHDKEYEMFQESLNNIDNKENPVMIEIGSWWGFWSLCFRKKYPKGKNILVELGKRHLVVGINNFKLNNFTETHYWGGFYLNNSNTYSNKKSNYDFEKLENEYFDDGLLGNMTGPEIDFIDIYSIEKLNIIDMLHMDIQGSELPIIKNLFTNHNEIINKKIKNIVVATHSNHIHNEIFTILKKCNFKIQHNEEFGKIGGDGMIIANK